MNYYGTEQPYSVDRQPLHATRPITLTLEQEAWLQARVANGDFASVQEAARQLIDERIAERARGNGRPRVGKAYVDEARVAVGRGEFVSLEQRRAHNAAALKD